MNYLPPEATSEQTHLDDINRQFAEARASGGYTAVLNLAQERQDDLRREFSTLTAGHELRRMSGSEREELQRTWTPEKARLNQQITELQQQISGWALIEDRVAGYAANEAHGWTILDVLGEGVPAKVLDNGKVLSAHGGVRYEEEDGTIVDTSQRSDQWHVRHRSVAHQFGQRVRGERLHNARRRCPGASSRPRVVAVIRPRERRAAASSSTSGTDPGDPDEDSESSSGGLRHVSIPLAAELNRIAEQIRARGGVA